MSERQLRFRVWDGHKMHYATLKELCDAVGDDRAYMSNSANNFACCVEDDRGYTCPVMQFTGLYDRNQTPIFEGDFIDHSTDGDEPWPAALVCFGDYIDDKFSDDHDFPATGWFVKFTSEFDGQVLTWSMPFLFQFGGQVRVIGNVHQHPHLLEPHPEHL